MDDIDESIHETNISRQLRRCDLNLLLVFDALMRERSVTRAAAQVFLSQPAMSNALKRLRAMLDDPVLVRTRDGMQPTPRALALEGPIRRLLHQIDQQLRPVPAFDPATSDHRFVIATTDYGESVVVPPLALAMARQAPHAGIEVRALEAELPEQRLESGELTLVIGVDGYFTLPARLRSQPWLEDRLVCVARRGHPVAGGGRVTLSRYLACRHVYPSPLGRRGNIVDDWLEAQGRQREIAVTARSYWAAARITAQSDYLLSVPERVARSLVQTMPLQLIEPPKDFPGFRLELIWHPLYEEEGAVRWLIDLVTAPGALSID